MVSSGLNQCITYTYANTDKYYQILLPSHHVCKEISRASRLVPLHRISNSGRRNEENDYYSDCLGNQLNLAYKN